MIRLSHALLLLALPLSTVASGREAPVQDPAAIPQDPAAPKGDGAVLDLGEVDTRLTVPVAVGTRGPYNFIIDTGAERTSVSRELAGLLALVAGKPVTVTTMAGSKRVNTVVIPELTIQSIGESHTITAPAFEARNLGASGLLGIDTLRTSMVSIDFEAGTMTVRKSVPRRRVEAHSSDEIVVVAKSLFGQLIVTDAFFGDTRIQVVLDTGSQVSMGNAALRQRVERRLGAFKPLALIGVTGETVNAEYTLVPSVKIGGVEFQSLPVAFAEVAPFKKFGLEKKPAILLGMDGLRSFRRVEIDFPNRQVRFLMPRPGYKPKI